MLHNGVALYRRAITFSYIVSTNQSRLRIPKGRHGTRAPAVAGWGPAVPPSPLPAAHAPAETQGAAEEEGERVDGGGGGASSTPA